MTFSLDAVAEPLNIPPRVALTATESDPDVSIQSCALFRDGVPLRFDAVVTGDQAVAYDYDAPFDVALAYRADAVETAVGLDWTETWASLAAWTVVNAGWSVAAGDATTTTHNAWIKREISGEAVMLEGPAPALTVGGGGTSSQLVVGLGDSLEVLVTFAKSSTGTTSVQVGTDIATMVAPTWTPGAWTLTIGADSVAFVSGATSLNVAMSEGLLGTDPDVQIYANFIGGTGSASIGDISTYVSGAFAEASATDTATLTGVEGAWLTNAADPDLAVLIDTYADTSQDYFIERSTFEETTLATNTRALEIEGSADTVTVSLGPRKRETWTLNIATMSPTARRVLLAALANDAPISLRFPATGYEELDGGFYAVGDLTTTRIGHPALTHAVIVSLPLTPSRAPKFKPLWQWNWDTLAQTGMTWDDVNTAFDSWNDLLVGPN